MKRILVFLIPALLLLGSSAALAQDSYGSNSGNASNGGNASNSSAASSSSATIMTKKDKTLGTILADSKGMTVYLFTNDTKPNESSCTGGCAKFWPPVTATGDVTLASGIDGTLTTFDRADGTKQVAYNGMPLYYFSKDKDKGDAYGQGIGNIWYVIAPGEKFGAAPDTGTPIAASPEAGNASAGNASANSSASTSGTAISIKGFAFNPASVTVSVGTKVTWTNNDSVAHSATADDGSFQSNAIQPGSSFSFTFTKAGTFTYHCEFHPNMTATITVK